MIKEFKTYLMAIRNYSENTASAYAKDCQHFVRWYREYDENPHWRTVTRDVIDHYMIYMSQGGLEPSTMNRHISSLSAMFKYQMRQGLRDENPCKYESRAKLIKKQPNVLNEQELETAISEADERTALAMQMIYVTGVRLQELLDMKLEDVDYETMSIRVMGKGRKERTVYMTPKTMDMLIEYTGGVAGLIFANVSQREMRYNIWQALQGYARGRQLSPHAIRHTFATKMARKGMPTTTLAVLLGHEDVKTTQRYVNLAQNHVKEQYLQFQQY